MLRETMDHGGHAWTRATGWVAALTVATACVASTSAAVIHVDSAAAPNGDGQSWTTAFRRLQDGLAVAGAGDEVRVAGGVYRPDQSEYAHATLGDRGASFVLEDGVPVRGGYAGSANPGNPDAMPRLVSLSNRRISK